MCHDGICRCKKGYRKSKAAKGKCVKGEVPFTVCTFEVTRTKLGPDNGTESLNAKVHSTRK